MTATWYREGPLVTIVHEAVSSNATRSEIVNVLSENRFSDMSRRRVESIVAGAVERRTPEPGKASPSQPTRSDGRPRSVPTRFIDYGDIEHLGNREFSRLLGLTFERFAGNTVSPLLDAVDLLWHRQYDTVGVRVVAAQDAEQTLDAIEVISTEDTNPPDTRAPSRLVVVTAAAIDEELTAAASDANVELCGRRQVAHWLRIVQLPPSAYGPLLEEGEQSSFDTDSILDKLPPLPSRVEARDPLALDSSRDTVDIEQWTLERDGYDKTVQSASFAEADQGAGSSVTAASGTGSTTTSVEPNTDGTSTAEENPSIGIEKPDFDAQPAEGEFGHLYADPDEDGDFDGIDAWVDGLGQEES